MDGRHGESGGASNNSAGNERGKKENLRCSAEQIQELEAFFQECPHPDETQSHQLSRNIGLGKETIKRWFHNKRTQQEAQSYKAGNESLQAENERLYSDHLALRLENTICPDCTSEDETQLHIQSLEMENAVLKEQIEHLKLKIYRRGLQPFSSMYMNDVLGESAGTKPPICIEQVHQNSGNGTSPHKWSQVLDIDESIIIREAIYAMDELTMLFNLNESIWIRYREDGRYLLNVDNYKKLFPKPNYMRTAGARIESTKYSGEVALPANHVIEMLLDTDNWKNAFPTIVPKAHTIAKLETGSIGGSLNLIYEEMHVLSPLVAPRDFFSIHYCQQVDPSTWVMVKVSYDFIKELQDVAPTRAWRFPSGCMIKYLSNGKSTITWIEHVQVNDKALTHRLYRDLVYGSQAYGAKRWIASLQRICERVAFSTYLTTSPNGLEGGTGSAEGRRNLMKLSQRMVQSFFEALRMPNKLEFSDKNKSGVQFWLRNSSGLGQPNGLIVTAASSLWLPISPKNLFDFFKDKTRRAQWDVLASGRPVSEIAQVSTGIKPENCISVLLPLLLFGEPNMVLLQESSYDNLGGMVIYAPTGVHSILSVASGAEHTSVPILPSGFVISTDGDNDKKFKASSSSSSRTATSHCNGSLLTVALQMLVCCNTPSKHVNDSVVNAQALISSTIRNIKVALDCAEQYR